MNPYAKYALIAAIIIIVVGVIVFGQKEDPPPPKPNFFIDARGRKVPNNIRDVFTRELYFGLNIPWGMRSWINSDQTGYAENWIKTGMKNGQTREEAILGIIKHQQEQDAKNKVYEKLTDMQLLEMARIHGIIEK